MAELLGNEGRGKQVGVEMDHMNVLTHRLHECYKIILSKECIFSSAS